MGFVPGFLPWILYWALVGNVDFRLAVCVSLAVASGTQLVSRMRGQTWRASKSALLIFVLLTAAANCCQRTQSLREPGRHLRHERSTMGMRRAKRLVKRM